MSTEPTTTERVRAMLLATVMAMSIVVGSAAIAGGSVDGGSLEETDDLDSATDSTDEAVNETIDSVDDGTDETTDGTDGGTTDGTTDTVDGVDDGTDDTTEETTDDSTADLGETTGGLGGDVTGVAEDIEDLDSGTVSEALSSVGADAVSSVLESTGETLADETATDDGTESSTHTAGVDPGVVGVTAGAENQTASASPDAGAATFTFGEAEAGSFPSNGTVTVQLADTGSVAFDTDDSDVAVSGEGLQTGSVALSSGTLEIEVTDVDDSRNSSLSVSGLRFVTAADADTTTMTWAFGGTEDAVTVEPEYLGATGFGDDVPRGAYRTPEGTGIAIEADTDARTEGFHAEDNAMRVAIPAAAQGDLAFDTTAEDDVTVEGIGGDCQFGPVRASTLTLPGFEEQFLTDEEFIFAPPCEVGADETLVVRGLRFNVSGAGAADPAEFATQLEMDYEPVEATERVWIDAGSPVAAHAPVADAGETTVEAGTTATTGDAPLTVTLADDLEGASLVADGSQVTIGLDGEGVTFNESQDLEAVVDGSMAGEVVAVRADAVVVDVDGDSDAGDELEVRRADGDGIRFDVAENAGDTDITVTTTPGDEDVTQVVGSVTLWSQECASVAAAISDDEGYIGNPEISQALDYWRNVEEVPGTCGETISNPQISRLLDIWRNAERVEDES